MERGYCTAAINTKFTHDVVNVDVYFINREQGHGLPFLRSGGCKGEAQEREDAKSTCSTWESAEYQYNCYLSLPASAAGQTARVFISKCSTL